MRRLFNAPAGLAGSFKDVEHEMMMRLLAWLRARWMKVGVVLGVSAALAAAGCAQLAEKERELTFRVVPGDASWFSGLPAGVNEMDLPVTVEGKVQRVHAWWWPAEQRGAQHHGRGVEHDNDHQPAQHLDGH